MSTQNVVAYESARDTRNELRDIERRERGEQFVSDELHDRLEDGHSWIASDFRLWLHEDCERVIDDLLAQDERTREELMYVWRSRWIAELLRDPGWQAVARMYRLNVEE